MKRFLIHGLTIVLFFCLFVCTACGERKGAETTSENNAAQGGGGVSADGDIAEVIKMVLISCGGRTLEMELADTVSAKAFAERLSDGDITIVMRGYGGFEMVGGLGFSLEREDEQMTTNTGDVVLYSGNQIVIFYESNSWAYTKIGHIVGAERTDLLHFFGTTDEAQVTFSAVR